jgi:hypothetical protein
MRVPRVAAPAIAPGVDPADAGDVLGDGARAFALARTAGRTQLEATVMGRAKLRQVDAVTAAVLVRRLRTPLPPPELRLSLPESEAAAALVRDRRRVGELRYIAWAAA